MSPAADPQLAASPKVVLHDHLDGGLRPGTVIDLAREVGHELPSTDVDELAAWFHRGADRKSLDLYLETFIHTVAVMQTAEAIERVAYETAVDLAADNVVYAETRVAPELLTEGGLSLDAVIAAIGAGCRRAEADVPIVMRTIVCAMRHLDRSVAAATAARRGIDHGVVGFDLAGPEVGFPASGHPDALAIVRGHIGLTLHAGEADGLGSVRDALDQGAQRLGHGVRLVDALEPGVPGGRDLIDRVIGSDISLEVCPTSNLHTHACGIEDPAEHPIDRLRQAGLPVTVSCDNRLMSDVTVNDEWRRLRDTFGWSIEVFDETTDAALRTAFCDDATRAVVAAQIRSARDARPS